MCILTMSTSEFLTFPLKESIILAKMRVVPCRLLLARKQLFVLILSLASLLAVRSHAAEPDNSVPTHLWIKAGSFFNTNYALELHDNGDLVYQTTKGEGGEVESEAILHPSVNQWRDFRSSLEKLNV